MNNRRTGTQYENMAAAFLEKQGLTILEHSFRCRIGEIDLIAEETGAENTIVFIEVKYRKNNSCGYPYEAVTYSKRRTITKVAQYYRMIHKGLYGYLFRFDVISITGDEIEWYRDAFDATTR